MIVPSSNCALEKKPWERFLKPQAKTERIKYFNDVTKEIYESAYTQKQSQFISYLNGQREFRWNTKKRIEKLQHVTKLYEEGLVPKENILVKKYRTIPDDATLKDVSFVNRATSHIKATREDIEDVQDTLKKRKVQLYEKDMELKKWAGNENEVVNGFIALATELKAKVNVIEDDVANTAKVLNKKYSNVDVSSFDKKRKKRRKKEQNSKNKKKCKKVLLRNTQALLKKSGFKENEIEEICPNIYGKKAKRIISCEELVRNDPKIISYLRFIGALTDLSDETVISDTDVQYSDNSSSDNDF